MNTSLDSLSDEFKPLAIELLARLVEAGIAVRIISTRRTEAEHQKNLALGVSWIKHSKHLDGNAIDVAPYSQLDLYGTNKLEWDANALVWEKMCVIAEGLGLRCGYRWAQKDCGHYELKNPKSKEVLT